MRKKAIVLSLVGYVLGCLIGLFFSLQSPDFSLSAELPQILLGGIPGAVAMGSAVIYDIEEWSILRVTVTHFLVAMGAIILACFVLKWFEPWSTAFWILLVAELAGYILIWLIMYLIFRRKVRELNELLKHRKKNRETAPSRDPE